MRLDERSTSAPMHALLVEDIRIDAAVAHDKVLCKLCARRPCTCPFFITPSHVLLPRTFTSPCLLGLVAGLRSIALGVPDHASRQIPARNEENCH